MANDLHSQCLFHWDGAYPDLSADIHLARKSCFRCRHGQWSLGPPNYGDSALNDAHEHAGVVEVCQRRRGLQGTAIGVIAVPGVLVRVHVLQ